MSLDLFWEPELGTLVLLKPHARHGVKPFDEHPLLVKQSHDIDGFRMFTCETTGPIEYRTTRNGQRLPSHVRWHCFQLAEDLIPAPL